MHLNIPRMEIPAEQALKLMKKDGEGKIKKDSKTKAHIWLDNEMSTSAMKQFAPDRAPPSPYIKEIEGSEGWVGFSARGWRTKKGRFFSRVDLIFVGKEAIKESYEHKDRLETCLNETGLFFEQPYVGPAAYGYSYGPYSSSNPEPPYTIRTKPPSISELLAMTPLERFKALTHGKQEWEEATEQEMFEVKLWLDHEHHVAIAAKADLEKLKQGFTKGAIEFNEVNLSGLQEIEKVYRNSPDAKFGFGSDIVDRLSKVFDPESRETLKILYPKEQAPMIMYTDEQENIIAVAPCLT